MNRPASHAGSWYSSHGATLSAQINELFSKVGPSQKGARVLVGPHAGYSYCGEQLAQAYGAWDTKDVKRVIILGPSHHVYFKDQVLLSRYESYATPLGPVDIDTETNGRLAGGPMQYMTQDADDDEHSFEMHLPFLVAKCKNESVPVPKIIPIMVSSLSKSVRAKVVDRLAPYISDPYTTLVVSSDFCHWGRRFGYTSYVPDNEVSAIAPYSTAKAKVPIYESIEYLDRTAMAIASTGSVDKWDSYIADTGNTICGQKPISIILALLQSLNTSSSFQWLGYSQSSRVVRPSDSSVSYAAGIVQLS